MFCNKYHIQSGNYSALQYMQRNTIHHQLSDACLDKAYYGSGLYYICISIVQTNTKYRPQSRPEKVPNIMMYKEPVLYIIIGLFPGISWGNYIFGSSPYYIIVLSSTSQLVTTTYY